MNTLTVLIAGALIVIGVSNSTTNLPQYPSWTSIISHLLLGVIGIALFLAATIVALTEMLT